MLLNVILKVELNENAEFGFVVSTDEHFDGSHVHAYPVMLPFVERVNIHIVAVFHEEPESGFSQI